MRSFLIFGPTRGFREPALALRLQETVHAARSRGWRVDVVLPREDLSLRLPDGVGVYVPPRLLSPSRVPDAPSLRGIFAARLMFLRALPLATAARYTIFHGYDDGACVARAVDRATVRRFPFVAEFRRPVSTHDGPIGLFADIARRREQSVLRHASAVILPDGAMAAAFEKPPAKSIVSVIPEPCGDTNEEFFTVAEFETAVMQSYEFAALRSDAANGADGADGGEDK